MLSDTALDLIRDVFGNPDLLRGAHRIQKRVVAWGRDDAPKVLEHSAVVVSEQTLLEALMAGIDLDFERNERDTAWRILASRPIPKPAVEHRFGSRNASAAKVELREGFDFASCWIESLENGWLFLIPDSLESAWLLSVGLPQESLLDSSRMIAKEITVLQAQSSPFPSAPSIIAPLAVVGSLSSHVQRQLAAKGITARVARITFVEVLVVISIMFILAGLLLPALGSTCWAPGSLSHAPGGIP